MSLLELCILTTFDSLELKWLLPENIFVLIEIHILIFTSRAIFVLVLMRIYFYIKSPRVHVKHSFEGFKNICGGYFSIGFDLLLAHVEI